MSKYNSIKTEVDGIVFASKKEAHRYWELQQLVKDGQIRDLQMQVKYSIDINGKHICNYYADFVYVDCRTETQVVEDTKGVRTTVFRLKAKLMKACHNIDILET